jgi:enoyl-CoA hydratase/carnithine racemase
MDEPQPSVRRQDHDGIATLTLDRPAARNALSSAVLAELLDHLRAIDTDASVHVVVLAGNGPAFSAGHDLRELRDNPGPEFRTELFERCSEVMLAILGLRQPVIAKVHGVATAAGCQLVATCDLAVAGRSARFATPGVNIGLFCSTPMVALSRAVGRKQAMEMLLTGEMIDADEALRIGLVNRVVPDDELDAAVDGLAGRHRQGGLPPPGRAAGRRGLPAHRRGHGPQPRSGRRRRGHRRLPRQATADLDERVTTRRTGGHR